MERDKAWSFSVDTRLHYPEDCIDQLRSHWTFVAVAVRTLDGELVRFAVLVAVKEQLYV